MTDEDHSARIISIRPTGPVADIRNQYSDAALTNIVAIHGANINSLRQAIWARYTAMLIANSVLLAFAGSAGRPELFEQVGPFAGTVLCSIWIAMLFVDQNYIVTRMADSSRFRWISLGTDANVFLTMIEDMRSGRSIYRLGFAVALLFYVLHFSILVYHVVPE